MSFLARLNPFRPDLTPNSLVGLGRFELPTSRLSGVRSNQLSYRPFSQLSVVQLDNKKNSGNEFAGLT